MLEELFHKLKFILWKGSGYALSCIGAFFCFQTWQNYRSMSFLFAVVTVGIGVAIGMFGTALIESANTFNQEHRNLQCRSLTDKIKAGQNPSFYLYLRPFVADAGLEGKNYEKPHFAVSPLFFTEGERYRFEQRFSKACKNITVISIGNVSDGISIPRLITTESNWFEEFQLLARSSNGILIIPNTFGALSRGIKREIEWLSSNGLLHHCVFIQPFASGEEGALFKSTWADAIREFAKFGIQLPDYKPKGSMFTLSEKHKHCNSIELAFSGRQFKKNLLKLLASRTPSSISTEYE